MDIIKLRDYIQHWCFRDDTSKLKISSALASGLYEYIIEPDITNIRETVCGLVTALYRMGTIEGEVMLRLLLSDEVVQMYRDDIKNFKATLKFVDYGDYVDVVSGRPLTIPFLCFMLDTSPNGKGKINVGAYTFTLRGVNVEFGVPNLYTEVFKTSDEMYTYFHKIGLNEHEHSYYIDEYVVDLYMSSRYKLINARRTQQFFNRIKTSFIAFDQAVGRLLTRPIVPLVKGATTLAANHSERKYKKKDKKYNYYQIQEALDTFGDISDTIKRTQQGFTVDCKGFQLPVYAENFDTVLDKCIDKFYTLHLQLNNVDSRNAEKLRDKLEASGFPYNWNNTYLNCSVIADIVDKGIDSVVKITIRISNTTVTFIYNRDSETMWCPSKDYKEISTVLRSIIIQME